MRKILFWLFLLLCVPMVLWGSLGYVSFHKPVVHAKIEQIIPPVFRPPIGGVEIRPKIIRFLWGLRNIPGRIASNQNTEYLDLQHIKNIGGAGFLGFYMCNFDVKHGKIQNFNVIIKPNNPQVTNYISEVIQQFSGDYSVWADVQNIQVQIDFSPGTINVKFANFKLNAPINQNFKNACPLGTGTVQYEKNLGHPQYLFAVRGFQINLN